jgi:hypothetical protein
MADVDIYPVGAVISLGAQQSTSWWRLCDGALVTRSEFPELFVAIGYTYGKGTTDEEFRLPDYRGRFLRGAKDTVGVAQDYATAKPATPFAGRAYWLPDSQVECNALPSGDCSRFDGTLVLTCCTSGGDAETRPVNAYVDYYIKVRVATAVETAAR